MTWNIYPTTWSPPVQHYAAELERVQAILKAQADLWHRERSTLEDRLANVSLGSTKTDTLLEATVAVIAKLKALNSAQMTVNERPARKALEASLKTLQTTFERI